MHCLNMRYTVCHESVSDLHFSVLCLFCEYYKYSDMDCEVEYTM
jgi:hypothetical protein